MSADHYLECTDPECPGCLPTDDDVRAMSTGQATIESRRRGLPFGRVSDRRAAILDDADDYRARSAAHRLELFPT